MEGPEGSVRFDYGQDSSHTKTSESFETLTTALGHNGMRFYHNANIFGKKHPIDVDMVQIFEDIYDSSDDWSDDLDKLFYQGECRTFPNLSWSLLKPDSECIWYADPNQTHTSYLNVYAMQGSLYTKGKVGVRSVNATRRQNGNLFQIDYARVDYSI